MINPAKAQRRKGSIFNYLFLCGFAASRANNFLFLRAVSVSVSRSLSHSFIPSFFHSFTLFVLFLTFSSSYAQNDSSKLLKKHKDIPAVDRKYNDLARFLAGMSSEKGSSYEEQSNTDIWKNYAANLDANWKITVGAKMDKMSAWSSTEFGPQKELGGKLFYPFAGPDFIHMYTFFPYAKEYVMIGLEHVGTVQDLSQTGSDSLNRYLASVGTSLYSILNYSFFQTISMSYDFKSQDLNGIIPVILLFMARTGNKILDIKGVNVDTLGKNVSGTLTASPENIMLNYGVKIDFYNDAQDEIQTVYYYSVDLSDAQLPSNPGYTTYLNNMGEVKTFIKSASYLMQYSVFSQIRSAILKNSSLILQDDSGVPFQYFDTLTWNVNLYGTYNSPIPLFVERFQQDIYDAYRDNSRTIKPLDFGIGYNYFLGTSNLLIAKKKLK